MPALAPPPPPAAATRPPVLLLVAAVLDPAVAAVLASAGLEAAHTGAATPPSIDAALRAVQPEVLVCDAGHHATTDPYTVLACVRAFDPSVPVVVVVDRLTDPVAEAIVLAGARSVIPREALQFLAPAVERGAVARREGHARREAERAQATLIGNLPGMVLRAVPHQGRWQLTYASSGAHAITGYAPALLTGEGQVEFASLIHPDDRAQVLADVDDAMRNGRPAVLEYRLRHRDGSTRWVNVFSTGVHDAEGALVAMEGFAQDITARKQAELALRDSHQRFELIGRATTDIIWDWDLVTGVIRRTAPLEGGNADFGIGTGENRQEIAWDGLLHPEDHERVVASVRGVIEGGQTRWSQQFRLRRADGGYAHVHDRGHVVRDASGRAVRMIGATQDISERVRAELVLARHARAQAMLADFGREALSLRDTGSLVARAVEVIGQTLHADAAVVVHLDAAGNALSLRAGHGSDALPLAGSTPAPMPSAVPGQTLRPWLAAPAGSALEVRLQDGPSVQGLLGAYAAAPDAFDAEALDVLRSIGTTLEAALERKAAEDKLLRLAQFDALTGLPNRTLLMDRLDLLLARSGRNARPVALLFLDLDRFKNVNDTWGHGAGDRLLREVAARLQACVRPGDTVSRFGGDEFTILLNDLARGTDVEAVVRRVLEALAAPFDIGGGRLRVTASLGIAMSPDDGMDAETLLKNADTAMYRAKEEGRDTFQFFTGELNRRVIDRLRTERELGDALERGEFVLHYQPRIDLASGRTVGAEALVRWQHPERGLLAPAHFIDVAEDTGLILPIGRWVMHTACAQLRDWHAAGHAGLRMAVNVSPAELRRADVPAQVRDAVAASGIPANLLEVELTEGLLMDGADAFIGALNALRATGVSIAIDDFGTGYSSLAYLKRFPVDTLKIDRAFVTDLDTNADDAAIVQAVITLARQLRLSVVAEGVETPAQADMLRLQSCDGVQGYLFGRPMPAAEFAARLEAERRLQVTV